MLLIVGDNFSRINGMLIRAENEGYPPATTGQPSQAGPFLTNAAGTEQLNGYGTGRSSLRLTKYPITDIIKHQTS